MVLHLLLLNSDFSGDASLEGQVDSGAKLMVVSVGAMGKSYMTLSGGKTLGPEGAQQLADLLREAPPLLSLLELRYFYDALLLGKCAFSWQTKLQGQMMIITWIETSLAKLVIAYLFLCSFLLFLFLPQH